MNQKVKVNQMKKKEIGSKNEKRSEEDMHNYIAGKRNSSILLEW